MANRKSLNTLAKKDNLKLIQGNGYLYWIGLTDEIHAKLCTLQSTAVYVNVFNHLSYEQWLEELESIKKQISQVDNYLWDGNTNLKIN